MITQSLASPPTVPTPRNQIPTDISTPTSRTSAAATRFAYIESPVGELLVTADAAGALTRLYFPGRISPQEAGWTHDEAPFVELRRQLDAYFAGELEDFDLRLAPSGTSFQLQVWRALREIPYGATASYGEIARAVGQPAAARAVGGANNRNPIAIIVPCHRVIGAGGSLTGYGGGLDRKRLLLELEAGTPTLV
ncbi:MAG TPA: methylated-DNA--[protein]-cysteine S-methyltransferase [Solirubrobacteraceae bacterium]|jgi:methylated-DNA-[protein]-cysteine S-methyltransferase